jgi:hypothetical protein
MYDDGWSVFEILTLDADIFYNIFFKTNIKTTVYLIITATND